MNRAQDMFAIEMDTHPLKSAFLGWQCRVRQLVMRQGLGRPDASIMPELTLPGAEEPMGSLITVLSKKAAFSRVPELKHLVMRTHDPAQRREKAIQLLAETYYQRPNEFADILTATFPPDSPGARAIEQAGKCRLTFSAYNQRYELECRVIRLKTKEWLYQATWWHNLLFNPNLNPDTIILGFQPNWDACLADPEPAGKN